jgi:antirestriction protein ArdC
LEYDLDEGKGKTERLRCSTGRATRSHNRDPMQGFVDTVIAEGERDAKPWVRPHDPDKCAGLQVPFNPTGPA